MSKKQIPRHAAALFSLLVLGALLELLLTLPAIRAAGGFAPATKPVSLENAELDGFAEEDGKLVLTKDAGTITFRLDGTYLSYLVYDYQYAGMLNATVRIGTKNAYGEHDEHSDIVVTDRNMAITGESWVPVHAAADYAQIGVNREELDNKGLSYVDFDVMPLAVTGIRAEILPRPNGYRLLSIWAVLGILYLLIRCRGGLVGHVERGFLAISLAAGILMVVSLPANKVSWDEEVHYAETMGLANFHHPIHVTDEYLRQFITGMYTWPTNQPGSGPEQRLSDSVLADQTRYGTGKNLWSTDLNNATVSGYLGEAAFVKLGELLHLPFPALFRLGRFGNLLLWCVLMTIAIRILPVGKCVLAFLGLMPEPLFLASVYSYDPSCTAFMAIGLALILRMMLTDGHRVTWPEYVAAILAFALGCTIKAVYAPLLLLGLLIPREHFRNRREEMLMKAGFVLAVILLLLSFMLPVLLAPRDIGDTRGGDTSEKGQMAYILGQPLGYAVVLIRSVVRCLPSYCLGENSLGTLGHIGQMPFSWILYAGSAVVILTAGAEFADDPVSSGGRDVVVSESASFRNLTWKRRLVLFLLIAVTGVFVWTSMYIAFTVPGKTAIEGVQGRYYLPFLWLLWIIAAPRGVRLGIKRRDYSALVLGLGAAILFAAYFAVVYVPFCR
jgi:uncharacterized membrane protein